jgi:NADH-quinone oxidoreductase subunit J
MPVDYVILVLALVLTISSLGVILLKNPVHASLSFLLTLLALAFAYFELSAEFIAAMQILVYAGAILVIFIFVIVLFQDAYQEIEAFKSKTKPAFLFMAAAAFLLSFTFIIRGLIAHPLTMQERPEGFGSVQSLGQSLYIDYFFPFEAVILIFLIALVGVVYIGKRIR